MAGSAKPFTDMVEGKYSYGTVSGTDYLLDGGSSIAGLFDGVREDAWNNAKVGYWYGTNCYVIITLHEKCNIWRSGTTTWSTDNANLTIYKYNESTKAYDINVTNLYTKNTTAITNNQWEIFVQGIPAGKYKFASTVSGSKRIDSEWFIQSLYSPTFLTCNNEYYIPTIDYYNQETSMFNVVDLATVKASTTVIDIMSDITVGEETFRPIDKFKEYPVKLGFKYDSLTVDTEEYKSDEELIVGAGNIYLTVANNIDKFQLNYTKTNDDSAFMVCSVDNGATWLTYDFENLEFKPVEGVNIANVLSYSEMTEDQKVAYENSKSIILENGISIDDIGTVNWNLLKDSNDEFPNAMRFAYCIIKTGFSDNTNITSLSWQFDAKGYFKQMKDSERVVIIRDKYIEIKSLIDSEIVKINAL